jgi:alanyl-tRNA synthetase
VTGEGALDHVQQMNQRLEELAASMRAPVAELPTRLAQLLDQVKAGERELLRLQQRMAAGQGADLAAKAVDIGGLRVLAASVDGVDAKQLRELVDQLKSRFDAAAIVLGTAVDGKVQLAAGVTPAAMTRVKAGDLVNFVAQQVGGKGGGRADLAMAGGTNPAALAGALESVEAWVRAR